MAKELPYFKFEPGQWENGNIQMCSRESKGLFIDLCSMYWARVGDLPYALALQKLCNGNKVAFQELESIGIFQVIDDKIVIEFLDEQLGEFFDISEKRRESANKRWNDASALQKQSKSNAIREEKKREKKKREEEMADLVLPFGELFKTTWFEWTQYRNQKKQKLTLLGAQKQIKLLSSFSEDEAIKMLNQSMFHGWTGIFELKTNYNGKQNGTGEHPAQAAARAFAERVGGKSN